MKEHKKLLIAIAILATISVLLYLFRDRLAAMFSKGSGQPQNEPANSGSTSNPPDLSTTGPNTPPAPKAVRNKNIAVGSPVYSDGVQKIQRIDLRDGHYHSQDPAGQELGLGSIGDGSLIGTAVKQTGSGWYVRAKPALTYKYYWVGNSQVYTN